MNLRTLFLLALVLLAAPMARAQNVDSLRRVVLDPQQPDSERLYALEDVIWNGYFDSRPDSGLILADSLERFAIRAHRPKHEGNAANIRGAIYYNKGEFVKALAEYEQGKVIYTRIGSKKGLAAIMVNMAGILLQQGDHQQAIADLTDAMRAYESIPNKKGMADCLNNIGLIYLEEQDLDRAQTYFEKAMALNVELNVPPSIGQCLNNLAIVAMRKKEWQRSISISTRAMDVYSKLHDERGITAALVNTGSCRIEIGDLDGADSALTAAMVRAERIDDMALGALATASLTNLWVERKQPEKAIRFGLRSMAISEEMNGVVEQRDAALALYTAYKLKGDPVAALKSHERYILLRDSLLTEDNQRAVLRQEYQYNFDKKELADSLAHQQQQHVLELVHQKQLDSERGRRNVLAVGGAGLLFMAIGLFRRLRYVRRTRDIISRERDRSDALLLNILPAEVAEELKEKGSADAKQFDQATILFTDFKGFTGVSEKLSPSELVEELNVCFKVFDNIITGKGIEKIKTIGDAYMCAGGLPDPQTSSPVAVVEAALEMQAFMIMRKSERDAQGLPAFEMRVGIHTGPVVAGIVGVKKFAYDIWGDTVNTASRMESSGEVGQVNISESTYDLVKGSDGLTFTSRGKVQAKGKGEMEMYFVESASGRA